MEIDIIPQSEYEHLTTAQKRLVRQAQNKKNELQNKTNLEIEAYREKLYAVGMKNSSMLETKRLVLRDELYSLCSRIADDLRFELNSDKSTSGGSGDSETGYLVDYSLSYYERYVIVKEYYLAITDREERMKKYSADDVAKKYLGTYYETLYNVLGTIDR